ncbi:MAG: nucleoside monophosphate kinase [Candidatus Daviesbacteria bacterium]|nr:nucleoside monophosphate kinase [Candidatus Daviesbacteria bacterium]
MKILLIGPQGSGKSTQAKLLAEFLNLPKISTGDIFRELAKEGSEEGRQIRQVMNEGKLINDNETAKITERRLQKEDVANGFVLDGYPRNLAQKELFDPGVDTVIYLKVPDEEVIKRMMTRGRADDSLEAIKIRLGLYYEQTKPLLDYYRNQGILAEIDGLGSVEEIQQRIRETQKK